MKYSDLKFKNGDRVIVHSLGKNTPGEWPAVIVGLSVASLYNDGANIWIVSWSDGVPQYKGDFDPWEEDYCPFNVSTMPQAYIKLDPNFQ